MFGVDLMSSAKDAKVRFELVPEEIQLEFDATDSLMLVDGMMRGGL